MDDDLMLALDDLLTAARTLIDVASRYGDSDLCRLAVGTYSSAVELLGRRTTNAA